MDENAFFRYCIKNKFLDETGFIPTLNKKNEIICKINVKKYETRFLVSKEFIKILEKYYVLPFIKKILFEIAIIGNFELFKKLEKDYIKNFSESDIKMLFEWCCYIKNIKFVRYLHKMYIVKYNFNYKRVLFNIYDVSDTGNNVITNFLWKIGMIKIYEKDDDRVRNFFIKLGTKTVKKIFDNLTYKFDFSKKNDIIFKKCCELLTRYGKYSARFQKVLFFVEVSNYIKYNNKKYELYLDINYDNIIQVMKRMEFKIY